MTAIVIYKVLSDTSHLIQLNFITFNGLAVFTEYMLIQYIVYVSSVPAAIETECVHIYIYIFLCTYVHIYFYVHFINNISYVNSSYYSLLVFFFFYFCIMLISGPAHMGLQNTIVKQNICHVLVLQLSSKR